MSLGHALRRLALQVVIVDAIAVGTVIGICIAIGRTSSVDIGTGLFFAAFPVLAFAVLPLLGSFQGAGGLTTVWVAGSDARTGRDIERSIRRDINSNLRFMFVGAAAGIPLLVAGILITLRG